ncbi:sensor histidine kinase [Amycolatopsis jejuensis]|uniref:sensor histidine kinase n=1 Tax=Amycolatopsis jejuensis TaxID=330084 RepID=UPI0005261006|nr:HAMP domain-containing sensor histidine kinase [Amycolatopsis jejuensis]
MRRWTLRARLTLIYTTFTAAIGAVLLGITILLARSVLPAEVAAALPTFDLPPDAPVRPMDAAGTVVPGHDSPSLPDIITHALLRAGGLALAVAVAASAITGWLVARRALAPVRRITAAAQQVAGQDLSTRIRLAGPADEVKELADTFDHMLGRLERSFAAQRRFVANAAHELKTPVATQRAVAEVALARPGADGAVTALGTKVLASTDQQERLLESLLALAQNPETVARTEIVDLGRLTGDLLPRRPAQAAEDVEARAELGSAKVLGDAVLLGRMLCNLLDNAFLYNHPGGWVSARTGERDGGCVAEVENTGPELGPDDAARLFEPFRRLCLDRQSLPRGSGLGLSVVRAIAEAHGGSVTAQPRPGGGLLVRVSIPGAA